MCNHNYDNMIIISLLPLATSPSPPVVATRWSTLNRNHHFNKCTFGTSTKKSSYSNVHESNLMKKSEWSSIKATFDEHVGEIINIQRRRSSCDPAEMLMKWLLLVDDDSSNVIEWSSSFDHLISRTKRQRSREEVGKTTEYLALPQNRVFARPPPLRSGHFVPLEGASLLGRAAAFGRACALRETFCCFLNSSAVRCTELHDSSQSPQTHYRTTLYEVLHRYLSDPIFPLRFLW